MNATRRQLQTQFDRVVKLGWLAHFEEAAKITAGYFDVADLIGIASRETNLDPKWLKKAGDGGHGFGLMQIDIRSFPEFTKSPDWKDARLGILYGAKVLMEKLHDCLHNQGKLVNVKGRTFTAKKVVGSILQHIVIAGYNNGRWPQYAYATDQDIDRFTTGHDYGSDVMQRAAVFRSFLKVSAASPSKPQQESPATLALDSPANSNQPLTDPQAPPIITVETKTVETIDTPPKTTETTTVVTESETVTVKAVAVSLWTKILAGVTGATGLGINVGNIIETKLSEVTMNHVIIAALGVGLILFAIAYYRKRQESADLHTQLLIKAAADKDSNTVKLEK